MHRQHGPNSVSHLEHTDVVILEHHPVAVRVDFGRVGGSAHAPKGYSRTRASRIDRDAFV